MSESHQSKTQIFYGIQDEQVDFDSLGRPHFAHFSEAKKRFFWLSIQEWASSGNGALLAPPRVGPDSDFPEMTIWQSRNFELRTWSENERIPRENFIPNNFTKSVRTLAFKRDQVFENRLRESMEFAEPEFLHFSRKFRFESVLSFLKVPLRKFRSFRNYAGCPRILVFQRDQVLEDAMRSAEVAVGVAIVRFHTRSPGIRAHLS